ncbi:MAG: excinuclease ABC subunit UvrC [bacterium]|nr:excinuclease ABC subunit UvrC [bacterium]
MNENDFEKLREEIRNFPAAPGVYIMKNDKGVVIYVGKAASLKARVRSYFSGQDERYQVRFLMNRVSSIEIMVTDTEKEALILEDILIKKHRPRYNINLKDDKTYLSLKVDMSHDFPRVEVVRVKKKGSKGKVRYFGPYSSAQGLRETLGLIQKLFPIRTCRETNFNNRVRPCLSYQIKRCCGPCCGHIDRDSYGEMIAEVLLFLEGRSDEIIKRFKSRMKDAAGLLDFEEAARLRDLVANMERTLERQRVFTSADDDRDVIGTYREGANIAAYILFIREGKMTGGKGYYFGRQEMPDEEILSSFVKGYYAGGRYVPGEVLLAMEPGESGERVVIEEWLAELRGKSVSIKVPKRGEKLKLLAMAAKNARQFVINRGRDEMETKGLLEEMRESFSLRNLPRRMECYDNSNIQGTDAVGSMVVFIDGQADKSRYRRFKIKSASGADDFAMMYEVLTRRLGGEEELPDLIVIDGGKGQLGMALKALEEAGLEERIDLVSLAKEKVFNVKGGKEKREERVYIPGRKNPLKLKERSASLYLFQRIRDEAHRFAVNYHKNLRSKRALSSPLDDIKGLGPAKKKALLKRFGSLKGLREASLEDIQAVKGIRGQLALAIVDRLK